MIRKDLYTYITQPTLIVAEDLSCPIPGKKMTKSLNRKLNQWMKGELQDSLIAIGRKTGSTVATVNCAYTSQVDSQTGTLLGSRKGDRFIRFTGDVLQVRRESVWMIWNLKWFSGARIPQPTGMRGEEKSEPECRFSKDVARTEPAGKGPQGGIISPLLANIALDGLQELLAGYEIKTPYSTVDRGKRVTKHRKEEKYKFARYADDFVVISQKKEYLSEILPTIQNWLQERGLNINEDKTTIKNVRAEGFSFLGFDIRQFPTETLREGSNRYHRKAKEMAQNVKPGAKKVRLIPRSKPKDEEVYSCIIKPGKKETNELLQEIREYLKGMARSQTFENVIRTLNSKLRGWLNYNRYVCSKKTFSRIRHEVLDAIYRYLKRKHPQKSWGWIHEKYYKTIDEDKNNPYAKSTGKRKKEEVLINAAKDVPIIRHTKVKGGNSPHDPELSEYWTNRRTKMGKTRFAKGGKYKRIYENQKGICPICGEPIDLGDNFELHHIIPVKDGGTNAEKNLIFLHKHCHKAKHKHLHYK